MPEGSARELSRHLQRLQAESGRLERAGAPGAKQTSPKVEDALLRIDRFARRALLLTVFEQLSAEVVPSLRHSIPRTSSNHHSVTTWAQRRHDSNPLLSVF